MGFGIRDWESIDHMPFDVRGKRVTVVGAARSGLAAAGLLARKGAHVTLSDARGEIAEALRVHYAAWQKPDGSIVGRGSVWIVAATNPG